jgi:hypothetical protein
MSTNPGEKSQRKHHQDWEHCVVQDFVRCDKGYVFGEFRQATEECEI